MGKLTPEEIQAAKSSTHLSRHSWGTKDTGLNPCAKVAELRGVQFSRISDSEDERYGITNFEDHTVVIIAMKASNDVANWLGFFSTGTFTTTLNVNKSAFSSEQRTRSLTCQNSPQKKLQRQKVQRTFTQAYLGDRLKKISDQLLKSRSCAEQGLWSKNF